MLHIGDGGADGLGTVGEHHHIQAGRHAGRHFRQQRLDAFDHVDDIGTGLALDVEQDRLALVGPGREALVLGAVDDVGDILQPQRGAILIGEDQLGIFLRRFQLVVGVEHRHPGRAVEVAFGLVDVGAGDQRAHVGQRKAVRGKCFRVGADTHRRALATGDTDHADAVDLRQFLRHARVDQIMQFGQRQRFGRHGQGQHRRVGRVDLVVHRRRRQIVGQQVVRRVDRGLHFLFRDIQRHVQRKAQGNHRGAAGTGG